MTDEAGLETKNDAPRRMGLCLCGGGITGAMYEVGCLAALEHAFEDFQACDFDVFVGAASGSVVATALAGGLSAQRMYRALLDPADDFFPLQRQHLLRLDGHELRRMWSSAFLALRRLVGSVTSKPLELDVWEELERFVDSLPAGLFTVDALETFLESVLTRRGIPKTFGEMPRRLLLVANDLDAGQRAVFGVGALEDVSVARAMAASCAVPPLYAPVRVGDRDYIAGGVGESGHVDVAAGVGCGLVVVLNANVPVRNDPAAKSVPTGHGPKRRVRDKGFLWVHNQAWRLVTEARMQQGLAAFRVAHPEVEAVLVEPDRSDATMFMYSPMNFAARRVILEHGYKSTIARLRAERSPLRRAFEAQSLSMRKDLLDE